MKKITAGILSAILYVLIAQPALGDGFYPQMPNPAGGYPPSPNFTFVGTNWMRVTDNVDGSNTADLLRWRDGFFSRTLRRGEFDVLTSNDNAWTKQDNTAIAELSLGQLDNVFRLTIPYVDMRTYMDVVTYGAWLLDNTTDVTSSVQAAVTAAATAKMPLEFPPGKITVTNGTITVPAGSNGFVMRGAGWRGDTIISGSGAGATFTFPRTMYDVLVEDMYMVGDADTTALIETNAELAVYQRLYLTGAQVGLLVPSAVSNAGIFVKSVHAVGNTQFGIKVADKEVGDHAATVIHISDSWLSGNGTTSSHWQAYIGAGYTVTFQNNVIERTAPTRGVKIWGAAQEGLTSIISGNHAEGAGFTIGTGTAAYHGGVVAFGNYVSGVPDNNAAFTITRADNFVSFGNDFSNLTAGNYGYDFGAGYLANSRIGPDSCSTNYYTGSIGSSSIVFGTASASSGRYITSGAGIHHYGGLTSDGVFGYKGTAGNMQTLDGGTLTVAADNGTTAHTISANNSNQIAYVEIVLVGGFGDNAAVRVQTPVVKKIGVVFGINSNNAYDATITELLSSGDALNSTITLDTAAATGSGGTMTFTFKNTHTAQFVGTMTYTFHRIDATVKPTKS